MAAKGGVKGNFMTGVIMFMILGGIMGWMKINNIHDVGQAWDYFRAVSKKTEECSSGPKIQWNCKHNLDIGSGTSVNNGGSISATKGKDYTIDSDGTVHASTHIGGGVNNPTSGGNVSKEISSLNGISINPPAIGSNNINDKGVTTKSPKELLLAALDKAVIKEKADTVKYNRSEWRHWIGEPCNTRNQVLISQGKNVKANKTSHTCKIISGEWTSPYDNKKVNNALDLDIDHVGPLGYVASHGGQAWSLNKKEKFANDQNQLVAVTAHANRSKSDKGPSEYMPDDSFKCQYSKMWVYDINKYGIFITSKDKNALKEGINSCN